MSNQEAQFIDPISPGEYLTEIIEARGIKVVELAKLCGRPTKTISEILNDHSSITPETAIQLERVLSVKASLILNMESSFKLSELKNKDARDDKNLIEWIDQFPLSVLRNRGYITSTKNQGDLYEDILNFLGLGSFDAWKRIHHETALSTYFKQSQSFQTSPNVVYSWLRIGEIEAREVMMNGDLAQYKEKLFKESLKNIRELSKLKWKDSAEQLRTVCKQCGVILVLTETIPKAGISGAARWLTKDTPLIQLSDRYKTDDHFWFSFYHEAAHILFDGKKEIYLDEDINNSSVNEIEKRADDFAEQSLISKSEWSNFYSKYPNKKGRYSKNHIIDFANSIGINPSIVMGQVLHKSSHIKPNYPWVSSLRNKIDFSDL